jgi:hypothetical protein
LHRSELEIDIYQCAERFRCSLICLFLHRQEFLFGRRQGVRSISQYTVKAYVVLGQTRISEKPLEICFGYLLQFGCEEAHGGTYF